MSATRLAELVVSAYPPLFGFEFSNPPTLAEQKLFVLRLVKLVEPSIPYQVQAGLFVTDWVEFVGSAHPALLEIVAEQLWADLAELF